MRITPLISIGIVLVAAPVSTQSSGGGFDLRTVSTRADMVSGGDVLIQVTTPPSAASQVALTVNGREPRGELREMTPGTLIARLTDLRLGANDIAVGLRGQKAAVHLSVVNHPIAGPVFSGRHQTPFNCETQAFGLGQPVDTNCMVATRVDYFYQSTAAQANANPFKPYDVAAPRPQDLATTTTLDGKTVPYIVRREMGTINRAVYVIAFLHEPNTPLPDPWSVNVSNWNRRLVYSFGAGCQAGYHQGRTTGFLGTRSHLEETQLGDSALAQGYAIASSSLNVFANNCSDVISAETMMMVKEHFIERFGVPRYTIGSGRSGGSMQQHLLAQNYPGLLDGLIPTAAFADTVTLITHLSDCELLARAFDTSALTWTDAEKAAVAGEANWQFCARNATAVPLLRPANCDKTSVPNDEVYDASTNPKGVRCTYQDNMVNVFGVDPKTGFARRPFDNVGIQYGLKTFNARKITFEQFLDLNRRIGGHDTDGGVVARRTVADPEALRIAFQSGRVNDTSQGLAMVPIIDVRPYTDGSGDVHDAVNSLVTRARLMAANGTSANQVIHTYAPETDNIQRVQRDNLAEMEQWLDAIANDKAPAKSALERVIRNRPKSVTDACYAREGEKITDMARCAQMFPAYSNPRLEAGMPIAATMLKCQLKAVDSADYSVRLTASQLASIRTTFPSGVCDFTKKGVAVGPSETWRKYGGMK
ncbi:MAG: DUF6351 family protein [Vicinamibacterales bacterium]